MARLLPGQSPLRLDANLIRKACSELAATDARLAQLVERNGLPPLRLRPEGFATLVHLILQQQVSRASAQAVLDRVLVAAGGTLTAPGVMAMEGAVLREAGFSWQKVRYVMGIAAAIESGELDLNGLGELDDDAACDILLEQPGIGPWTAAVYVLTALGRPDVWAPGDRALLVSLGRLLERAEVPASDEAVVIAEAWRPWRAVAARLLWHDYSAAEVR